MLPSITPVARAFSTRSRTTILTPETRERHRPPGRCRLQGWSCFAGFGERDQVAAGISGRIDDALLAGLPELLDAAVVHALELHHQHAALGPVTDLVERDLTDNGIDGSFVEPLRDLRLIDRAGRLDGFGDQLASRVGERRNIEA